MEALAEDGECRVFTLLQRRPDDLSEEVPMLFVGGRPVCEYAARLSADVVWFYAGREPEMHGEKVLRSHRRSQRLTSMQFARR